tara:strand:- start:266 stop:421 length:156 start_codon:yes stop_codon:yes gene_type:complete
MEIPMFDTLVPDTRRAYEPPRLVLPSEQDCAPEGKVFNPSETTGFGTVGPS